MKASGLRWLSVMLLPEIPWAGRVWGLPFLTALAPSERYASKRDRPHKKLTDWGRQVLLQAARWLPGRKIVAVADGSFAAIELLNAVRRRVCMITRLRLDARLFDPPARRRPGTVGRPRVVGKRQPNLAERLVNPKTRWRRLRVTGWYGSLAIYGSLHVYIAGAIRTGTASVSYLSDLTPGAMMTLTNGPLRAHFGIKVERMMSGVGWSGNM